ncbi:TPA: MobC family replication-relaxation protein [Yersinia enterocolitica]|uniref:MobC family replication-relaxation protein n=1 Tax=Yersinia massiliensis TaxID=419257 RepID=UPI0015626A02|nr:MobC family replication-relaxation protein [Yersinia massiliensis]QKJ09266.1 molybdopterin-guanine dinucleotide biosynthesis protein MobC [Yersinia massiliensis]HDX9051753.1 molybdopterin-guanine dinucleotide biosynthesis protein MobC [Yersinia enterocolitica]
MTSLITDPQSRRNREKEKILTLLMFLKEETYSDFPTLMFLFNFKTHRVLYSLLKKVTDMGLIQKYVFESRGGNISLWGITNDGLSVVFKPEDGVFPPRFEPTRLKGWMLDHHLDNQAARLALEQKGATEWINGDRNNFLNQFNVKHRPDGLITLPSGQRVAIETERSLKTKARYQQIMTSHLLARTDELWFSVFYILPDIQKKLSLMKIFESIKFVIINSKPIEIETKHRNVFQFFTLDELKELSF